MSKIPTKLEQNKQLVVMEDKQFAAITPDKRKVIFGEIDQDGYPQLTGSLPTVMTSINELNYKDGKLTADNGGIDLLKLWEQRDATEFLISKGIDPNKI